MTIPFGSMVKIQFMAKFIVDPLPQQTIFSLMLLLHN